MDDLKNVMSHYADLRDCHYELVYSNLVYRRTDKSKYTIGMGTRHPNSYKTLITSYKRVYGFETINKLNKNNYLKVN